MGFDKKLKRHGWLQTNQSVWTGDDGAREGSLGLHLFFLWDFVIPTKLSIMPCHKGYSTFLIKVSELCCLPECPSLCLYFHLNLFQDTVDTGKINETIWSVLPLYRWIFILKLGELALSDLFQSFGFLTELLWKQAKRYLTLKDKESSLHESSF